jgi:hypothetical protein
VKYLQQKLPVCVYIMNALRTGGAAQVHKQRGLALACTLRTGRTGRIAIFVYCFGIELNGMFEMCIRGRTAWLVYHGTRVPEVSIKDNVFI